MDEHMVLLSSPNDALFIDNNLDSVGDAASVISSGLRDSFAADKPTIAPNNTVGPDFAYNRHNESTFDDARLFPALNADHEDVVRFNETGELINAATLRAIIVQLTSPEVIDYNLICDFFLTYRVFVDSEQVMLLLLTRLIWALQYINSSAESYQKIGKLVMLRVFVVFRHWIINYFVDDFLENPQLCTMFVDTMNRITSKLNLVNHTSPFEAKIMGDLKTHWLQMAHKFGSVDVDLTVIDDIISFQIPPMHLYTKNDQHTIYKNPTYRRSMMLSLYDNKPRPVQRHPREREVKHNHMNLKDSSRDFEGNKHEIEEKETKEEERKEEIINPQQKDDEKEEVIDNSKEKVNDNIKEKVDDNPKETVDNPTQINDEEKHDDSHDTHVVAPIPQFFDENAGFATNGMVPLPTANIAGILPPTPVKKMDFVVVDPVQPGIQRKTSIKKFIDGWKKSLHKSESSETIKDSLLSPRISDIPEEIDVDSRIDVLSARIVDELEYLVRLYEVNPTVLDEPKRKELGEKQEESDDVRREDVVKGSEVEEPRKPEMEKREGNEVNEDDSVPDISVGIQDISDINTGKIDNLFSDGAEEEDYLTPMASPRASGRWLSGDILDHNDPSFHDASFVVETKNEPATGADEGSIMNENATSSAINEPATGANQSPVKGVNENATTSVNESPVENATTSAINESPTKSAINEKATTNVINEKDTASTINESPIKSTNEDATTSAINESPIKNAKEDVTTDAINENPMASANESPVKSTTNENPVTGAINENPADSVDDTTTAPIDEPLPSPAIEFVEVEVNEDEAMGGEDGQDEEDQVEEVKKKTNLKGVNGQNVNVIQNGAQSYEQNGPIGAIRLIHQVRQTPLGSPLSTPPRDRSRSSVSPAIEAIRNSIRRNSELRRSGIRASTVINSAEVSHESSFQRPASINWNDDLDNSDDKNFASEKENADPSEMSAEKDVAEDSVTGTGPVVLLNHSKNSFGSSISTPSNFTQYDVEIADLGIALSPQLMNAQHARRISFESDPSRRSRRSSHKSSHKSYVSHKSYMSHKSYASFKSYVSYDSVLLVGKNQGSRQGNQGGALRKKTGFNNLQNPLGRSSNYNVLGRLLGDMGRIPTLGISNDLERNDVLSNVLRLLASSNVHHDGVDVDELGLDVGMPSPEMSFSSQRQSMRFSTLCALTELPFNVDKSGVTQRSALQRSSRLSDVADSSIFLVAIKSKSLARMDLESLSPTNSVVIPGISSYVLKELAAIPDESYQSNDPVEFAFLKLEGRNRRRKSDNNGSPRRGGVNRASTGVDDTEEILNAIGNARTEDAISVTGDFTQTLPLSRAREEKSGKGDKQVDNAKVSNEKGDGNLTKLGETDFPALESSTPNATFSEIVLDGYMPSHVLLVDRVMAMKSHVSFVLSYDSGRLAEHLTLVEKDMLLEIDWKELIELKWNKEVTPVNSWLEIIVNDLYYYANRGVNLVVARFNLMVNWIISEVLLTRREHERICVMSRFIHIAQNCLVLQNYSTLMQVILALTSEKVLKLRETWKRLPPGDILILKNLELLASPLKNFLNIRMRISQMTPSKGCIPFVGLYLSDLIFNAERPTFVKAKNTGGVNAGGSGGGTNDMNPREASFVAPFAFNDSETTASTINSRNESDKLINFAKFRTSVNIVKSLSQCIEWSACYQLDADPGLLLKCLYIKSLDEDEMNYCLQMAEGETN